MDFWRPSFPALLLRWTIHDIRCSPFSAKIKMVLSISSVGCCKRVPCLHSSLPWGSHQQHVGGSFYLSVAGADQSPGPGRLSCQLLCLYQLILLSPRNSYKEDKGLERLCHLHIELGLEPDLLTPEPLQGLPPGRGSSLGTRAATPSSVWSRSQWNHGWVRELKQVSRMHQWEMNQSSSWS